MRTTVLSRNKKKGKKIKYKERKNIYIRDEKMYKRQVKKRE